MFALVDGNIVTSCDRGEPLLHNAAAFSSIASDLFVQPKDVFFVNNEVRRKEG